MMPSRFAPVALLLITMSTGCAVGSVEDDLDTTSTADSALTASGTKLSFAGGLDVPVAAVRSSDTHAVLTALSAGAPSLQPLELVVPPGSGPAILRARSGEDASLTLGNGIYGLGPSTLGAIAFPALDAKTKGSVFITIGFKPTEIKYLAAKGDVSKPPAFASTSAAVATFSLALGTAKSTPSMAIDALTLDPATPGAVLGLRMTAAEAGEWASWSAGERRDGTLKYTGPAGSVVIELRGVTAQATKSDSLQSYTVNLYCEHATMKMGKTDA